MKDGRYLITHNHFGIPLSIRRQAGEPDLYSNITLFNSAGDPLFVGPLTDFQIIKEDKEMLIFAYKEEGLFENLGFTSAEFKAWQSLAVKPGMVAAQIDWDGSTTRVDWTVIQEVIVEDGVPRLVLEDGSMVGASGGGVFWQGIHIANNWTLNETVGADGAVLSQISTAALNSEAVVTNRTNFSSQLLKLCKRVSLDIMIDIPPGQISAVVLGVMQDAGLPHIGCRCARCAAVYDGFAQPEYAASLAIVDARGSTPLVWLIDVTPDIKYQLNLLTNALGPHPHRPGRLKQPTAVFLTHAHMGHIGGLPHFGKEAMAVEKLSIYAAQGLLTLLSGNRLWHPLIRKLILKPLSPNIVRTMAPDLNLTPIPVPHRDEWGVGTFAFHLRGPANSLLYLPDIDTWERWSQAKEQLAAVDFALVDATFFSSNELGSRPPVAHPLVSHTLDLFTNLPCQLFLTHFNHTNPILDLESRERKKVLNSGVGIAYTGQIFSL